MSEEHDGSTMTDPGVDFKTTRTPVEFKVVELTRSLRQLSSDETIYNEQYQNTHRNITKMKNDLQEAYNYWKNREPQHALRHLKLAEATCRSTLLADNVSLLDDSLYTLAIFEKDPAYPITQEFEMKTVRMSTLTTKLDALKALTVM
jgi:hypothetical protein